jgi:hypothetical protein
MRTDSDALRRALAAQIIDYEPPYRLQEVADIEGLAPLPWKKGTEPRPAPMQRKPRKSDPLPAADVVVITWTVAEGFALADVLTPKYRDVRPGKKPGKDVEPWYEYRPSNYRTDFLKKLRRAAPAVKAGRLGSYFLTRVTNEPSRRSLKVLCFKSELHLNRDWISANPPTVPIADLFAQIISEVRPKLIITVGTAGATYKKTALGDVMLTRAARFRLSRGFRRTVYNRRTFKCGDFRPVPAKFFQAARPLLAQYQPQLDPKLVTRTPRFWAEWKSGDLPRFAPILTTDRFEFGTSKGKYGNYLQTEGCGVEMGDAVLGMVIDYIKRPIGEAPWRLPLSAPEAMVIPPQWLVIRNASDPQIDGAMEPVKQIKEAVFYYKKYGYWTSVNSAFAVWSVLRGASI